MKKWKLRKNVPLEKKEKLYKNMQSRAQADKPSMVTYKGKNIDTKTLRRYVKTERRKEIGKEMALQPGAGGRSADFNAFLGHPPLFGNRM